MLPVEQGGTTIYKNGHIYLYEYVNAPQVLNGWIFSAWGLFDYGKYLNDLETVDQWENTIMAIAKNLPRFDNGFWSLYSDGGGIDYNVGGGYWTDSSSASASTIILKASANGDCYWFTTGYIN